MTTMVKCVTTITVTIEEASVCWPLEMWVMVMCLTIIIVTITDAFMCQPLEMWVMVKCVTVTDAFMCRPSEICRVTDLKNIAVENLIFFFLVFDPCKSIYRQLLWLNKIKENYFPHLYFSKLSLSDSILSLVLAVLHSIYHKLHSIFS